MTQKKNIKKRKTAKKKNSKIKVVFWVLLAIIVIPIAIFGWILLSASFESGSPVIGNRYDGDLDPAITNSDISDIESAVKNLSGVEDVNVELTTATLRVYADISDSATSETAESMASQVYTTVTSILSPSTYFSQHDDTKMYDLEIHVYNRKSTGSDDDGFVYVIETKTSSMEEPITQLVSEPIDADLAQQLRDAVEARNNPTPTPSESGEITLNGEEGEVVEETPTPETDE